MPRELRVEEADLGQALESFVASKLGVPYLTVRGWIRAGYVMLEGAPAKHSRHVRLGDRVLVSPPGPAPHPAEPEDLPLPIRYEDSHLVVVAKPAGMATHPGPGWWHGSCVNALLHAIPVWPGVGGVAGPGIVHRLDRDTSGLLLFAKTDEAHRALVAAAAARDLSREYLAWVEGDLPAEGTIDAPLGRSDEDSQRVVVRPDGKRAVTRFRVMRRDAGRSLALVTLETGRTHQIRVHLATIGHPVVGDRKYGHPGEVLALHAWRLGFIHPLTGEALSFTEPPPETWKAWGPVEVP